MNEHVWRTFKAVGEHQSLSQAARALNLSQSAVSQQIHQLESAYGTPLLIRTSQGVRLNDAGEIVYRYVTQLLQTWEASKQAVAQHLADAPARLTVGASLTIAEFILPRVLARMSQARPRPQFTLYMANSHDIKDRVMHKDIDLGLIEAPLSNTALAARPFLADRLHLVVSQSHPLANRNRITISELRQLPLVIREPGSGTRMVVESALGQLGISLNDLNIHFVLGTTQAIKAMIIQQQDASILSPYTILPHERHLFHIIDVEGLALLRHFTIIHHHEFVHPLAEALVRALMAENWGEMLS
ncbi:LysR family transcriptional regulator [Sulfobacillus harzensis]|uniref:LysR family transcriptional regulator n=1 Tax=Sulfobacillus harzensis TaxID=2729629 RepID=A0A7Y0L2A0_9FIRM|nr:LysR family transcriptional regulator [Sulfobacillus harzensis]NMP21895.1 LysR family transcriptional regulator [Sulfobacillus harzensis]